MTGLFWLNLLFVVIAWVVAKSICGAFAMIASLTIVPLSMLVALVGSMFRWTSFRHRPPMFVSASRSI